MMQTTYLTEKSFSTLVDKMRNKLKMIDELMRVVLEEQILPQFEKKIAQQIDLPSSSSAN